MAELGRWLNWADRHLTAPGGSIGQMDPRAPPGGRIGHMNPWSARWWLIRTDRPGSAPWCLIGADWPQTPLVAYFGRLARDHSQWLNRADWSGIDHC